VIYDHDLVGKAQPEREAPATLTVLARGRLFARSVAVRARHFYRARTLALVARDFVAILVFLGVVSTVACIAIVFHVAISTTALALDPFVSHDDLLRCR
jgi:hypothetical protein